MVWNWFVGLPVLRFLPLSLHSFVANYQTGRVHTADNTEAQPASGILCHPELTVCHLVGNMQHVRKISAEVKYVLKWEKLKILGISGGRSKLIKLPQTHYHTVKPCFVVHLDTAEDIAITLILLNVVCCTFTIYYMKSVLKKFLKIKFKV